MAAFFFFFKRQSNFDKNTFWNLLSILPSTAIKILYIYYIIQDVFHYHLRHNKYKNIKKVFRSYTI